MGTYLSTPITKKNIEKGSSEKISFCIGEMQGWRKNMEDATIHKINLGDGNSLFGVFDGHGGAQVSNFVKRHFSNLLTQNQEYKKANYTLALDQTFQKMDILIDSEQGYQQLLEIRAQVSDKKSDSPLNSEVSSCTGCTANVVLITPDKIFVANAGDSRSVLCRGGIAIALSKDHKPESPEEEERVVKAGGKIDEGRINGTLNLTRSFGDFNFKRNDKFGHRQQMVTCSPQIREFERNTEDEFILSGCDGIWQSYLEDSQGIINLIKEEVKEGVSLQELVIDLLDYLIAKDTKTGIGCDNMSVILIKLN